MPDARMLTTTEVAERLAMHRDTISRNAAKIPGARKVWGRWRFDADVFEGWLKAQQEQVDAWAGPKRGIA